MGTFYRHATEGSRETTVGPLLSYSAALVYRPGGAPPGHHHDDGDHFHGRWSWVAELNGHWEGRTEVSGQRDDDTGGYLVLFSPGVRYSINPRWELFSSVGVPIWQDMNGDGHETEYRVTLGISAGLP